ncbi:MAG: O-antigen ligase family protein [Hyphomicrobiaceae bacterium]
MTAHSPLSARSWLPIDPRIVMTAYAGLLAAAMISPRASAVALAVIGIMALAGYWLHRRPLQNFVTVGPLTLGLGICAGWACLSTLWSPVPAATAGKAGLAVLFILAAHAAVAAVRGDSAVILRAAALGLVAAVVSGALFAAVETVSGQALTRGVFTMIPLLRADYDKHLRIVDGVVTGLSPTNINRRTTLVTLLLWPTLFAAASVLRGRLRMGLVLALVGAALLLFAFTHHQSSQAALLAGAAALGLYTLKPRMTGYLLGAAWGCTVLLIVPVTAVAYKAELHRAEWLPPSARHRVVIWGYTAERIAKAPLLGIGADSTAHVDLQRPSGTVDKPRDHLYARATGRHAHNVYLQVWYELGAIGALLLLPLGFLAVYSFRALTPAAQPWGAALFAASAAMMASSYSLWQAWFQAAFGLGVVALALADALQTRLAADASGER